MKTELEVQNSLGWFDIRLSFDLVLIYSFAFGAGNSRCRVSSGFYLCMFIFLLERHKRLNPLMADRSFDCC